MSTVITFMEGTWGRLLRIVLGLVLIYIGLVTMHASAAGIIVAIIGLVPLVMGIWGPCLLGFIFKKK